MALVQVADLLEDRAKVEIQALAALPVKAPRCPMSRDAARPAAPAAAQPASFRYEERERVGVITLTGRTGSTR
jgi:hypothetical protein